MTKIEETVHAILSPSGSKRWMTCAGSVALIEWLKSQGKIKKNTTNKYAAEGSVAHSVHEDCLLKNKNAKDFEGEVRESDSFKFTVNRNMIDAVQESIDYVRNRIEEAEDFGYTVEVLVEKRSSLKHLNIEGLDGGTADVILIFRLDNVVVEIEVIDYKHGQGVSVEVINNTQALCYVTGVVALPELNGHGIHEGIKITISQPRAFHPDGGIRSWDTDKDYILNWEEDELIPKAKATLDPNAPLVPSDDGCRFCEANGQCEALYDKTQEIAIADFAEDQFPDPQVMTSEQKIIVLDHANMLRSFIVAVEAQVQHEVDNGSTDYENRYKLVQKTTQRKLLDDAFDPDFSPLLEYISEDDLYVRKRKGIGELEVSLKDKFREQKVKGFGKKVKTIMGEVTMKPKGSLVIAPISDKRIGVQPSLVGDFNNLD